MNFILSFDTSVIIEIIDNSTNADIEKFLEELKKYKDNIIMTTQTLKEAPFNSAKKYFEDMGKKNAANLISFIKDVKKYSYNDKKFTNFFFNCYSMILKEADNKSTHNKEYHYSRKTSDADIAIVSLPFYLLTEVYKDEKTKIYIFCNEKYKPDIDVSIKNFLKIPSLIKFLNKKYKKGDLIQVERLNNINDFFKFQETLNKYTSN